MSHQEIDFELISYGILERDLPNKVEVFKEKAITFLFLKCMSEFETILTKYTDKTISFKKLDKRFYEKFIVDKFMPLITKYEPKEESLGLRVKHLINADLSSVPHLVHSTHNFDDSTLQMKRALNRATSAYIVKLEEIQTDYIKNMTLGLEIEVKLTLFQE